MVEKRRNKKEILKKQRRKKKVMDQLDEANEKGIDWKDALVQKAEKAFQGEGEELAYNLVKLFKEENNVNI